MPSNRDRQAALRRLQAIDLTRPKFNIERVEKLLWELDRSWGAHPKEVLVLTSLFDLHNEALERGALQFNHLGVSAMRVWWDAAASGLTQQVNEIVQPNLWASLLRSFLGPRPEIAPTQSLAERLSILLLPDYERKKIPGIPNIELNVQLREAGVGWYLHGIDCHIITPAPKIIASAGLLHNDQGPAVRLATGTKMFFLRGVRVQEEQYWHIINRELPPRDIMSIRNVELRRVALERLEPEDFLKHADARLLDVGNKGTQLYEFSNFWGAGRRDYCIIMRDPSTGRMYIEWVPPEIGSMGMAELCQAHAFGVPIETWLKVSEEA